MMQDKFIRGKPSNQNAADCFEGQWYSKFPEEYGVSAGDCELFGDARLEWAFSHLNPASDWEVLELGPLEGGHSHWLEKRTNVRAITAIEANRLCWLRCLVAKEIVDLKRTRFLLGDFLEYLRKASRRYDLALALGVLYHMEHPLELLALLAASCDRLALWTQFADEEQMKAWREVEVSREGFTTVGYVNDYGEGMKKDEFIGGVKGHAVWLTKEGVLDALRFVGYETVTVGEVGKNQFGGEMTLVASLT